MCLRAKDHLEGTKVAVFPSLCAPQKDQSGSAADWRPPTSVGQEGDGRPGYPRRSGRPRETSKSSVWVRATVAARRTGAVELLRYAASYGQRLLSEAHPPAQPFGVTDLLLGLCPSFKFSLGDVVENFVVVRLPETFARWVQKVVRDCRTSLLKRRSQT